MQVGKRGERGQDARAKTRPALARRLVAQLVRGYQLVVSPWLGPACRFEPSCSRYAIAAIERHGVLRGGLFSLQRLARCHPLGGSGFDPIP